MRVDGPNSNPSPIPVAASTRQSGQRLSTSAQPSSPAQPSTPHQAPSDLSVVVEIQKDNRLVFRFVDQATGQIVQQIPSEQMLRLSEAIAAFLQQAGKSGLK